MQQIKPERVQQPDGTSVEDYWRSALRMLSDVKFLDSLINFDKDNIPDNVIEKIRKEYLKNPDFDPEKIKKVSTACEGLCRWVYAMSEYDKVSKVVAPKRRALAEAQEIYDTAMSILQEKREQLRQVQVSGSCVTFRDSGMSGRVVCAGKAEGVGRFVGAKKNGVPSNVR